MTRQSFDASLLERSGSMIELASFRHRIYRSSGAISTEGLGHSIAAA
jgi:hypothetical protein